ncbi:unnamed protein product [Sphacelaria rigidula]
MLFVLCKTVTEDESGALFLNGTLVQRILWEGPPPENARCFPIDLKGPLAGGQLQERRTTSKVTRESTTPTHMLYSTINMINAPIDVQPHWSLFPFRILKGKVELELQAVILEKRPDERIMLCPDLCICDPEHLDNLVRVKRSEDLNRSRTVAFLLDVPTIEICKDQRLKKGFNGNRSNPARGDLFITYPQMTLTFWLHEPVSKVAFKIFGPLLLVLVLMLLNFEEAFGFGNIGECFEDGDNEDYPDYLANATAVAITAVLVIPSIRSTSVTSTVRSFTVDDTFALVFTVGLTLSAWPHCGIAFVGCMLSCAVVLEAMASLVIYKFERERIINGARKNPIHVDNAEDAAVKPSASEFNIKHWRCAGQD